MKRWTVFLLASLFVAFGGCTDSSRGNDAALEEEPTEVPDELAFEDSDLTEVDEDDPSTTPSSRGFDGVLDIALARPSTSLPYDVSMAEQEAVIVSDLLYDGLTEAVGIEGRLRPGLAADWWPNADFTQWTFALDADRLDLVDLEKDDVVRHFKALEDQQGASGLANQTVFGQVAAIDAGPANELVFTLTQPNAGFPWLMSGLVASVVGPNEAPTGRFVIEKESATTLELVPISGGSTKAAFGVSEWVERVVFHWVDNAEVAYDQLTLTTVDAAVAPASSIEDAQMRFGARLPARTVSRFYVLNTDSGQLDEPLLQGAVLAAIDRERIVVEALQAPTYATDGVVAPTAAGYRVPNCGAACEHSPEAAEQAVARYVSATGQTPTLRVGFSDEAQRETAESIAADLDRIGMDVELVELSASALADSAAKGGIDVYAFGWVAAAGSVDAVVPQLFGSSSSANPLGFGDDAVDELLNQAAVTERANDRWGLLADAHDLALQQGSIVPIASAKSYLIQPPSGNQLTMRADGSIDFSR